LDVGMKQLLAGILCGVMMLALPMTQSAEQRRSSLSLKQFWTNKLGQSIEAEFVSATNDTVTLSMEGKTYILKLADLTPKSQALAEILSIQLSTPQPPPVEESEETKALRQAQMEETKALRQAQMEEAKLKRLLDEKLSIPKLLDRYPTYLEKLILGEFEHDIEIKKKGVFLKEPDYDSNYESLEYKRKDISKALKNMVIQPKEAGKRLKSKVDRALESTQGGYFYVKRSGGPLGAGAKWSVYFRVHDEKGDLIQERESESSQSVGSEGNFNSSHFIFLNKPFKKFIEIRIYGHKSSSSPDAIYRVKRK
jgi:hypothetical protein